MNFQSIIVKALSFDEQKNYQAAFREYVKAIQLGSTQLITIIEPQNFFDESKKVEMAQKQLILMQRCFDRSKEILEESKKTKKIVNNNGLQNINKNLSEEEEEKKLLQVPYEKLEKANQILLEECQKQYAILAKQQATISQVQYQTRMTDLNLHYIRNKTENENIAKAQYREILQKIQDKKRELIKAKPNREQIQKEETNLFQQISLNNNSQTKTLLFKLLTLPDSKFGSNIINFVKNWKDKAVFLMTDLTTRPEDKLKIETPRFFSGTSKNMIDFNELKKEIMLFKDELKSKILSSFVQLDQEILNLTLEEVLFPQIYSNLLQLYKLQFANFEEKLNQKYKELSNCTLSGFSVPLKFLLTNSTSPYQQPIETLQKTIQIMVPEQKLSSYLKMTREIVGCVDEDFKKNKETSAKAPIVGAEELLPILCFVLIKSAIPNLYSEIQLLTDFTDSNSLIGEKGYILASFQSCIEYLFQHKEEITPKNILEDEKENVEIFPKEEENGENILEDEEENVEITPEEEELLNLQLNQYLRDN